MKRSHPHTQECRGGVFRAVRLLEGRLASPPSVQELATEAALSPANFKEAFCSIVGESVTQHIARLRVEWAASLLKSSDVEPQEINKPWLELMTWAQEQQMDLSEAHFYGLWFDDWEGTTTTSYRYESAILLFPSFPNKPPPDPFFVRTLKLAKWLSVRLGEISTHWTELGTDLPWAGYRLQVSSCAAPSPWIATPIS